MDPGRPPGGRGPRGFFSDEFFDGGLIPQIALPSTSYFPTPVRRDPRGLAHMPVKQVGGCNSTTVPSSPSPVDGNGSPTINPSTHPTLQSKAIPYVVPNKEVIVNPVIGQPRMEACPETSEPIPETLAKPPDVSKQPNDDGSEANTKTRETITEAMAEPPSVSKQSNDDGSKANTITSETITEAMAEPPSVSKQPNDDGSEANTKTSETIPETLAKPPDISKQPNEDGSEANTKTSETITEAVTKPPSVSKQPNDNGSKANTITSETITEAMAKPLSLSKKPYEDRSKANTKPPPGRYTGIVSFVDPCRTYGLIESEACKKSTFSFTVVRGPSKHIFPGVTVRFTVCENSMVTDVMVLSKTGWTVGTAIYEGVVIKSYFESEDQIVWTHGYIEATVFSEMTRLHYKRQDCTFTLLKGDHVLINVLTETISQVQRATNIKLKIPLTFKHTGEKREVGTILNIKTTEGIIGSKGRYLYFARSENVSDTDFRPADEVEFTVILVEDVERAIRVRKLNVAPPVNMAQSVLEEVQNEEEAEMKEKMEEPELAKEKELTDEDEDEEINQKYNITE